MSQREKVSTSSSLKRSFASDDLEQFLDAAKEQTAKRSCQGAAFEITASQGPHIGGNKSNQKGNATRLLDQCDHSTSRADDAFESLLAIEDREEDEEK